MLSLPILSPKWRARLLSAPLWCQQCVRTALAPDTTGFACTSLVLARSQLLTSVFNQKPVFYSRLLPLKGRTIVGWGRKWSGQRATELAAAHCREALLIEDGFVRSVGRSDPALSVVLDHSGIFYDAAAPSDIEQLACADLSEPERNRARNLIALWRSERVSKYNAARDGAGPLPPAYVLVCDQTRGDASISFGGANAQSFLQMLEAALSDYPDRTILLKTHPDVTTRGKAGHFDLASLARNERIQIISDPIHPSRLIAHADAVYTVTSQMGFEALIWGKPVYCFGMPFYAGWGLTDDKLPATDRRQSVTLEQLVHATLVKYSYYIDPVTMQQCEPENTFKHVGLQRRNRHAFPDNITAIGFSRWKRPFIQAFLQGSDVTFRNTHQSDNQQEIIAVWGRTELPGTTTNRTIIRLEDGFLRSSGLGADLVRPLSLVVDDIGIYYDATRPSRIERIFQSQNLNVAAVTRARALREKIIERDLTKYNLGQQAWTRPDTRRPVLLVVGQVETDASIRLGSPDVKSNIALLKRVRLESPTAYIVYKPHPDVVAGLRKRGRGEETCASLADEVLTQPVSLSGLVAQVDEIHTMTSLFGFEALLRGAKVACHGLPFYAGWGLTEDRLTCPRRTRTLSIEDLIYGALIAYPRYFNYEANCFVEPEQAIEQLTALAESGPRSRSLGRKILRGFIIAWLKLSRSTR